jgi:hypothetical protein
MSEHRDGHRIIEAGGDQAEVVVWEALYYELPGGISTRVGCYVGPDDARKHCEDLARRERLGAELKWEPFDYGSGPDRGAWELYEIGGSSATSFSHVLTGYSVAPITVRFVYTPEAEQAEEANR